MKLNFDMCLNYKNDRGNQSTDDVSDYVKNLHQKKVKQTGKQRKLQIANMMMHNIIDSIDIKITFVIVLMYCDFLFLTYFYQHFSCGDTFPLYLSQL